MTGNIWCLWRVSSSFFVQLPVPHSSTLTISPGTGVHLTLFLQCLRLLLRDKTRQRSSCLLLAFICLTFIIGTLYVASEALIAHNALINYASIPEWFAFYFIEPRLPVQLLYTFVAILGNWMCNCLMVSL